MLYQVIIEGACRAGCRFFDLTGAVPGSPLAAFKEKLGGRLHFTYDLRAERLPVHAVRKVRQHSEKLIRKAINLKAV